MKKSFLKLALAVLTVGLLGSCSKINERIDGLEGRINGLENEQIASINTQIANINSSIADLGQIRSDISSLKQSAENHGQDIFALQEADETLGNRIVNLEDYIDGILPKYAEKEWVEATFSTLEQYEATCDAIAEVDAKLGSTSEKLSKDIKACADSLTKWVNKTFEGYYTAAQMDAKVTQMKSDIDSAKAANKITDVKADSISVELTKTKTEVDTAKAAIRAEYKAAVKSAIEESEGKLTKALTDAITEVNESITILFGNVAALETTVATLTGRVDKLEKMIQSVTIVPVYSDGSVEVKDGILYLDIVVEPSEAVVGLTKDSLKVLVNEVKAKTKSVSVDTVAVTKLKVDAVKGTVTARADISTKLPADNNKALTIALNVKKGLSDFTTKFYPVEISTNVETKAGSETTKVTIKADEDFPEAVMGKIEVEKGFVASKPTSIEVSGIGTVIFDETATNKIKTNAKQAGATSVLFKVEDVTTTKPVENADVVLEVTMKTVDETGTEVYCEDKAAGEVTIQIPMDEDVVYVNSVTLVNADGDPIEGGVVPGSEEIENGILTFKVNHFSKYAVDYVTRDEFVSVTGVSIDKTSATVEVGDTLRLVATIAPEDATNKKVTWSSDKTEVATVDATGKVTAVAFGKATITVTTKDGGKTATCEVKVTETKTMSEILGTNPDIPKAEDMTPPSNAWENSTDKDCKAFVGYDGEDTVFVVYKRVKQDQETDKIVRLGMLMDDDFEKIDDNTYRRVEESVGTFTVKMAGGKFTSYEFAAVSGSEYEALDGTYSSSVVLPAGALSGVFSVSATKKVFFSKGNLYADGDKALHFEANQYGSASSWDASHVSHFTWSSTIAAAVGYSSSEGYLFCDEDHKVSVDGGEAIYYALSKDEWTYLFNNHSKKWATVNGVGGYVIAPDGFSGTLADTYANDAALAANNLVFLPAAGYRNGSNIFSVGEQGCYRSSTASENDKENAYRVFFKNTSVTPDSDFSYRNGYSVRLITECQ